MTSSPSPSTGIGASVAPKWGALYDRAERAFAVAAGKWLTGAEPFTAKVKPEYSYPEYDQLMRLEEWYGRE